MKIARAGKRKKGAEIERTSARARPLPSFSVFRSLGARRFDLSDGQVSRPVTRQPYNARHESSLRRPIVGRVGESEREREREKIVTEEKRKQWRWRNERTKATVEDQATVRVTRESGVATALFDTNHTRSEQSGGTEREKQWGSREGHFRCRCAPT